MSGRVPGSALDGPPTAVQQPAPQSTPVPAPVAPDRGARAAGRATVYDVARRAGVSIKTVSRVVNASPEVQAATRERVEIAMAELAYRRNPAAHALVTGSSAMIGVVVDSIADRFFSTLVSVVEERALARGISVLIASTGRSGEHEQRQIQRLIEQDVRALLIAPTPGDHGYLVRTAADIPVVLIDRGWELPGFDVVRVQDEDGARAAVEHLLDHGHRRIAFLGESADLETVAARRAGHRAALAARGLPGDPGLLRADCSDVAAADRVTRALLAEADPPTALFASNPRAAMGAVSALHATGRTDVALISFGDFDLAESLVPAVTVVDHDPRALAEAAVARLFARMDGHESAGLTTTLPLVVVPRGSGEIAP